MLEPLKDVVSSSNLLDASLKQYLGACSAIDPQTHPIPKSLSHLIENELSALDSYEVMIRKAKSALGRAKNYSPAIVPINSLSSEVLSQIFWLVLDASCRGYDQAGGMTYGFPKYPDILMHVFSRWRQVATSSCMLWTHIDLVPRYLSTTRILTRAKTLVGLAGQSPLELHVSGAAGSDLDHLDGTNTPLSRFLSHIMPRLQSLELAVDLFANFHLSILESCLVNCTPGMLTRLIIQLPNDSPPSSESESGLIEAAKSTSGYRFNTSSLTVDMQQEDLEALWLPIKTLYLCGIYPHWSSKAYHGLVELRLLGLDPDSDVSIITITEAQLVGILESSPRLRVLQFGMKITDPLPQHTLITPVCLDSLEVLDLSTGPPKQTGTILRWLAPGPKPPIVSLSLHSSKGPFSEDIKQFLARSRITRLAVSFPCSNYWSPDLLSLSSHLQTLVFRYLAYYSNRGPTIPFPEEYDLPPSDFRPNYLHLIFCQSIIEFGWLRQVLERRPIQRITLWGSSARLDDQTISRSKLEAELLRVCPVVRILRSKEPSPIQDWHLLPLQRSMRRRWAYM